MDVKIIYKAILIQFIKQEGNLTFYLLPIPYINQLLFVSKLEIHKIDDEIRDPDEHYPTIYSLNITPFFSMGITILKFQK